MSAFDSSSGRPMVIASGFPGLDSFLGGGIRRGDLVVLGGDSGSGKSALALAIALRAARRGENSAFLTCEMTAERVRERITLMDQQPESDSVSELIRALTGDPGGTAESEMIRQRKLSTPLLEVFYPGIESAGLRSRIAALHETDLVVVDHLQGLASGSASLSEELASSTRMLKALALEGNIAILLVAHWQGDRATHPSGRPTLDDFGVLGAVRQHADTVLSLFREEMYGDARDVSGAAELHVLKNRHGRLGYADLYFHKQAMRFEDMVDPDDPTASALGMP